MLSKRALKLLLLACLLLCLARGAAAQVGGVVGTVLDERNQPIQDAVVIAKGDYIKSVRTNDRGEFRLTLRPGRWALTVRKKGYRERTVVVFVNDYKGTVNLGDTIRLSRL